MSRRHLLLVASLLSVLAGPARADDPTAEAAATPAPPVEVEEPDVEQLTSDAPKNTVTLNPLRLGVLHLQIEYERATTDHVSLFVQPIAFHHATWYPFNKLGDHETAEGLGVDIGFRYFFFGGAPDGFYVGPMFSAYYAWEHQGGDTLEGFVLSPGAQAGYDAILFDWLVLGAGVGGSYGFGMTSAPPGAPVGTALPHSGPWINFRTSAGIAF